MLSFNTIASHAKTPSPSWLGMTLEAYRKVLVFAATSSYFTCLLFWNQIYWVLAIYTINGLPPHVVSSYLTRIVNTRRHGSIRPWESILACLCQGPSPSELPQQRFVKLHTSVSRKTVRGLQLSMFHIIRLVWLIMLTISMGSQKLKLNYQSMCTRWHWFLIHFGPITGCSLWRFPVSRSHPFQILEVWGKEWTRR